MCDLHACLHFYGFVFCSISLLFLYLRMRMFSNPRPIAGVPFDLAGRFRATLLLHTTCVRSWCNWSAMGWLRFVGSLKLQVSFAKEPCKRDYILRKRPIRVYVKEPTNRGHTRPSAVWRHNKPKPNQKKMTIWPSGCWLKLFSVIFQRRHHGLLGSSSYEFIIIIRRGSQEVVFFECVRNTTLFLGVH